MFTMDLSINKKVFAWKMNSKHGVCGLPHNSYQQGLKSLTKTVTFSLVSASLVSCFDCIGIYVFVHTTWIIFNR